MTARRPQASIAGRLTFWLGLVALTVFGAVGVLLHWTLERELLRAEDLELEGKADVVQHYLDEVASPNDLTTLRHHLDDALIGNGTLRVWIIAGDGQVLYGGSRAPPTRSANRGRLLITREDGIELLGLRYTPRSGPTMQAVSVLIGLDTRARLALMRTYDQATVLVCALGVAATVGLGAWVTRRGLEPLRRLSGEAAGIHPEALSRRLTLLDGASELVPLVAGFNEALDRIDDAYRQLQSFSADVAHELRTPLATLISGTEVALSRSRTASDLQGVLASNLEDLRALASMVNDMLFLAHADRGVLADNLATVSLRSEASAVADYLEASLDEGVHALRIDGDVQARVNASLLRRALVNLVTNAARYTPPGGTIVVTLATRDDVPVVTVSNPGPAIPEGTATRMFERFWRGDLSRTHALERHGLGLAIVRAIARMHGGEVFADSRDGNTHVGFTLGALSSA